MRYSYAVLHECRLSVCLFVCNGCIVAKHGILGENLLHK